jgi:SAM-dependent methyltransferase
MTVDPTNPAYAGQAFYTPQKLRIYDALVYGFNYPLVWRCPKRRPLELYNSHVSARHLDIGVATGRLLDRCNFPMPQPTITLMDLNPNSLAVAARRLRRYKPQTHQANVLEPWELPADSVDSIGMCNLLHCVPGSMADKAVVFDHARTVLTTNGVLFGATILGQNVKHTRLAERVIAANNRRGVLCNLNDNPDDLRAALDRRFASHEVTIEGSIALFWAQSPQ